MEGIETGQKSWFIIKMTNISILFFKLNLKSQKEVYFLLDQLVFSLVYLVLYISNTLLGLFNFLDSVFSCDEQLKKWQCH